MIRCSFLEPKFTFLDLGMFGALIVFNVCLKNGFFKSCFQQSAPGQNDRIDLAVVSFVCQNLSCIYVIAIKTPTFKLRTLLCFLCLINSL